MKKPIVSIVVAISKQSRAIGKKGKLLWHIPDDLKRFKKLTLEHPVIMGRKTFESILEILGKPLPERTSIIVTRNKEYTAEGCTVSHSVEEALKEAAKIDRKEIFVAGGGKIYTLALPHVDRLYLTLIDDKKEGDTFFPDYSVFTKKTFEERREYNGLHYTWINLEQE
ncbi:dihydrofolate reductase [Patescibacteria group bacterium]|nr:dihydrofolate reductase [Patescibacteria group bacterium]